TELLQQLLVHLAAVRRSIRLQLRLIRTPELVRGDVLALDARDGLARRGVSVVRAQEVRNVKNDEREANEPEAPFEPAHMPSHAIEHCHKSSFQLSVISFSVPQFQRPAFGLTAGS